MMYKKVPLLFDNFFEVLCFFIITRNFVEPSFIRSFRHNNFFVKLHKKTLRFLLDHIQDRLVIDKLNMNKSDLLCLINSFFKLKGILVKMLLKLFVRKIDAKLFKTVCFKDLKSKDIQYSNEVLCSLWNNHRFVNTIHNPIEHSTINGLRASISSSNSFIRLERDVSWIMPSNHEPTTNQRFYEIRVIDSKKLGNALNEFRILKDSSILLCIELISEISKQQYRRSCFKNPIFFFLIKSKNIHSF
mmetsp:Transcript_34823/g.47621  ORF Transcript_34823/g.47621 Transcript_34823/m.47621 type:complete len:245 (-) Transcript_34823:172-906(-)